MTMRIKLSNPLDPSRSCEVEAEIQRYQQGLFVPVEICERLRLKSRAPRRYRDYWGPIEIRLGNHMCFSGAYAGGIDVAIGFDLLAELQVISSRPTVPLEKLFSLAYHWVDLSTQAKLKRLSPGLTYAFDGLLTLIEATVPESFAAGELRKIGDRSSDRP